MGRETLLSPQAGSSLWAPFCSVFGGVIAFLGPLVCVTPSILSLALSFSPFIFACLLAPGRHRQDLLPSSATASSGQGHLLSLSCASRDASALCSSQDLLLAGLYGPQLGTEAVLSSLWGRDGGSVLGGRLLALCWRRDESRLQGCRQRLAEQTEFFFATRGGSTELKIKRKDQYLSV